MLSVFPLLLMVLYSYVLSDAPRIRQRSVWASDKAAGRRTRAAKQQRRPTSVVMPQRAAASSAAALPRAVRVAAV